VIEGEREKVERLIEGIKQGPRASRVDAARVEWETVTGEFKMFGVYRSM
jgi:acylphosphatase